MRKLLLVIISSLFILQIAFAQVTEQRKQFYSQSLNQLRHVVVFKPDSCTETSPCPVLIFLPGWTMPQTSFPFFNEVMSNLLNSNQIDPMLIVVPDGRGGLYTRSFYWNSIVNGNYGDYIVKDLVAWIAQEYPARKSPQGQHQREYWLLGGFSMGGGGCARLTLKHHEIFSGFGSFSGDLAYEVCSLDWFNNVRLENPDFMYSPPDPNQQWTYPVWGAASAFSPDTNSIYKAQFPLEEGTGTLRDSIFDLWLQCNSVSLANHYFNTLGNSSNSMNIYSYVDKSEIYFQFNKYLTDSLKSWNVKHSFKTHAFGHSFNEELATELLLWADAHFAPQIVHQNDIEIIPTTEEISSVNAYSILNPKVLIRNIGSATQFDVPVTCEIKNNGIQVYSDTKTIDSLNILQVESLSFKNWCPMEKQNVVITFHTSLLNDENSANDTLNTVLSVSESVDNFEVGFDKWYSFTGWEITEKASHLGTYSLCTNPYYASYENNINAWVDYRFSFNFSSIDLAYLSFWTKFETEPDADFGYIEISPDNGNTWNQIENRYTGIQSRWSEEIVSLNDYVGQGFDNVKLRFRFVTDANQAKPMAGWFLDDVMICQITHQHDLHVSLSADFPEKIPVLANLTPITVIRNLGKVDESNVLLSCQIDTNKIFLYSENQTIDALQSLHSQCVIFNKISLDRAGDYQTKFYTNLSVDENHSNDTLMTKLKVTNLLDDFESETGLSNWNPNSQWGLSNSRSKYGDFSLSSSPQGSYENNLDNYIEYNFSFNLSELQEAHITYWTQHFIEMNHDFGYVEVSADIGQTWMQVGDAYTGFQGSWKQDGRSLTQFCGPGFDDVRIRFRFVTDSTQIAPFIGWLLDDIAIYPTELRTDVSSGYKNELPKHFNLFSNYPNPFNEHTIIRYQIPLASRVKVTIYNLLGQEIIKLVDEYKQPGHYKVSWNGKDAAERIAPTGIYILKMEAGYFSKTVKMIMLK